MQAITRYLKQRGYGTVDDAFYARVGVWLRWYRGKVASFHMYRLGNAAVPDSYAEHRQQR